MIGRLIGVGIGSTAKGVGEAVSGVWGTIKGDKTKQDEAIHREQMAVLEQFAAEFAGRPPSTVWDSFVDGLNRLPRPTITFGVIGLFVWAAWEPVTFTESMTALGVVPEELWIILTTIVAFWFGGRLLSRDLSKPSVTPEQLKLALDIANTRAERQASSAPSVEAAAVVVAAGAPAIASPPPSLPREQARNIPAPSVERMLDDLLRREGGYVNHPADRGGPTNFGITHRTLAAWRGQPVTAADVQAMTVEEAREIYLSEYYFRPSLHMLPEGIQAHVFDIAVNSGPGTAIRLLQQALNRLGAGLKEDGALGPATLAAAESRTPDDINRELVDVRLRFYDAIVASDSSQQVFLNGWRNRANAFA